MGRIRTIKPEFFLHEELYDLELETGLPIRIAYIGLWCEADREGRFRWSPRRLKACILPYDDVDFSRVLDALTTRGFVVRYTSNELAFGVIPTFKTHQIVNNRERESELPEPDLSACQQPTSTRAPRVPHGCRPRARRKGREQEQEQDIHTQENWASSKASSAGLFDAFWTVCPKKVAKATATKAFKGAVAKVATEQSIPSDEAAAWLISRMTEFATTPKARGDFCPYPTTWLNQERYHDDPAAWKEQNGSNRARIRDDDVPESIRV